MPPRRQRANNDTASRVLDVAERLVQRRGYNGFSYADVASELKISKASLHYHFPGKAELGEALIRRYASRFADALEEIDRLGGDAPRKLEGYIRIYADVLREHRMCLCGMLAADYDTLPRAMREAVIRFFDDSESWLGRVLEQGRREGTFRLSGSATQEAQTIISGLEGALLVARPYGDVARFEAAATRLLANLASDGPPARTSSHRA
jgi:TetR/AcrR family transcriptional repressor of nem operon